MEPAASSSADAEFDADEDFLSLAQVGADADDENDDDEGDQTAADGSLISSNNNNNNNDQIQSLPPPWNTVHNTGSNNNYNRRINPLISLHNEIVGFCKLMEPHPEEMKEREALVEKFTQLAHSVFGKCQVDVFGSQVTGLCLPSSDIDIAIQLETAGDKKEQDVEETSKEKSSGEASSETKTEQQKKEEEAKDMENWDTPSSSPLQRLGVALRNEWMGDLSYLEVIENTRIPLVKFTHKPTGISVDVCFDKTTGPQAAALMKQYMNAMPPLRPLTFVLKYFMASRGLNQPYTGGVGSFMLQLMIVSFLQHRERDSYNFRRPSLYNLGALLVEFFELYALDFNFITTGFSVRFDGFFFPKGAKNRKNDFWQDNRPFSMAIENPLDPTMDVGKPSFRIQSVQRSFECAHRVLLSHVTEPAVPTDSILASILPPTEEMRKRSTISRLKPLSAPRSDNRSSHEPPRKRQRR